MNIGLITYDFNHLKTEYIVKKFNSDKRVSSIQILAMPFKDRPVRKTFFNHRPDQSLGIHTSKLINFEKVSFKKWDGITEVDNCDIFIIGGAGILDIKFAKNIPIINCHPGIIPTSRGLDSFKWTISEGDELGITLHQIDDEVDKGKILHIEKTPIFLEDTIEDLAKRHYELELEVLINFFDYINESFKGIFMEKPSRMRMPFEQEERMIDKFDEWKKTMLEQQRYESTI